MSPNTRKKPILFRTEAYLLVSTLNLPRRYMPFIHIISNYLYDIRLGREIKYKNTTC